MEAVQEESSQPSCSMKIKMIVTNGASEEALKAGLNTKSKNKSVPYKSEDLDSRVQTTFLIEIQSHLSSSSCRETST